MLTLHFMDQSAWVNLVASLVVAVCGNAAAFTFLPNELKSILLSNDRDGRGVFLGGVAALVIGLVWPEYFMAYAFTAMGLVFMAIGGLIWMKDDVTWQFLHPVLGIQYLILAIVASIVANIGHRFGYFWHGLWTIALPVTWAAYLFGFTMMALAPTEFKERIIPERAHGRLLVLYGLIGLAAAPLAVLNPAIMATWAALAGSWLALGTAISSRQPEERLLKKAYAIVYIPTAIVVVYLSSMLF